MSGKFNDEDTTKLCIELLSDLILPLNTNEAKLSNETLQFDEILEQNLQHVRTSYKYKNLAIKDGNEFSWQISDPKSKCRWHFVCTCLYLMETIRNTLQGTSDEKAKLLSMSQKKTIESGFQFVLSLGLLPYLLAGVGVALDMKSKNIRHVCPETLKDFAKYRRLCFVTDTILYLNENDVFHELIVTKHLEDVLAALLQLSFAPIKKPVRESPLDLDALDDDFEVTEMTFAMWSTLEENRRKYQNNLLNLQKRTYQPFVIRKLLLLNAQKAPRWLKLNVTKILNDIIIRDDDGVVALTKAVVEVDSNSPTQWTHIDVIGKLLRDTIIRLDETSLQTMLPQFFRILRSKRIDHYELIYIRVVALTIKLTYAERPETVRKYILDTMLKPLEAVHTATEDQINATIDELYNLYVVPTNSASTVPVRLISPVSCILLRIYCKVKDGISYLKSPVKELLEKLLRDSEEEPDLRLLFDSLLMGERAEQVTRPPAKKKFMFTDKGGVQLVDGEGESSLETAISLLELIKNMNYNENLIRCLFVYLLKKFIEVSEDEENAEKRLTIIFLLSDLSQNETTMRQIVTNSENIIKFIGELLQLHTSAEDDPNNDIICVCLTFLTLVLYDLKKKKNITAAAAAAVATTATNWALFDPLLGSLEKLKKFHAAEVKLLATEVYNLIKSRNIAVGAKPNKLIEEVQQAESACQKAITDACDVLLPVRAHALMELISLLRKGDTEALAKKEEILCLFQENMKDKDSFLYLRAIEGLSAIASLKPDVTLPLLCEEFVTCDNAETRLKLGEILMRTVKSLKDFAYTYKQLLLNTYLSGAKSEDHLVRTSSLSNLGELCLTLKYNLEDTIYEILLCARNIALHDHHPESRRAAVFLISSILRGLDTYMFKVLEPTLLDLYRMLQRIRSTDSDESVRVHAQLSVEAINENTKKIFTIKPSFEKNIRILDPPM